MNNKVRESSFVASEKTLTENIGEDFVLLWLDPTCGKNEDNDNTEKQLRTIDSSLQVHSTIEQSLNFICEIKPQNVFIIISGSYGESVIDEIDQISNVVLVYVFCHNISKHERWTRDHPKIGRRVFNDVKEVSTRFDVFWPDSLHDLCYRSSRLCWVQNSILHLIVPLSSR